MTTMTASLPVSNVTPTRVEEFVLTAAARLQSHIARRMIARATLLHRDEERLRAFSDARDLMLRHTLARGL